MKRASRNGQTGRSGETAVKGILENLDWGPVPVLEHDVGTDFFVQVRDTDLFELGLLLGVQVKSEKRYFGAAARKKALSLDQPGWQYAPRSQDDVPYWLDHTVPHILVLYDRSRNEAYWVHVTPDVVSRDGKVAKVFVPASQRLGPESREALLRVATTKRPPSAWSGSMWDDLSGVDPAERLRYAMLTPRIAAPHLNRRSTSLSSDEAIASLLLCRFDGLAAYQEAGSIPSVSDRVNSSIQWRLYHGIYKYLAEADLQPLE